VVDLLKQLDPVLVLRLI